MPKLSHGHTRRHKFTKLYTLWANISQRCSNPKNKSYHNYGGRGVTLCERWRKFSVFAQDIVQSIGEPPQPSITLDRIDNDKGYEPGNVRWATRAQQVRNSRRNHIVTVYGVTGCLTEMCERFGVRRGLVQDRLRLGWSVHDAFSRPVDRLAGRFQPGSNRNLTGCAAAVSGTPSAGRCASGSPP
jgi:hypothetical protein